MSSGVRVVSGALTSLRLVRMRVPESVSLAA